MFRKILLILLPLAFAPVVIAQENMQNMFDEFARASRKEFDDFRDRINENYSEFLRQSWKQFNGMAPVAPPVPDDSIPVVPPPVAPLDDKDLNDHLVPVINVVPSPDPLPAPEPVAPIIDNPICDAVYHDFILYGTECTVRYDAGRRVLLSGHGEDAVADFWSSVAQDGQSDNLLYDCLGIRADLDLCDWAYYKLALALSESVYPDCADEAVLFAGYVLAQSGYKLRLGYSHENTSYHLAMAVECHLYDMVYYQIDGENYFLTDGSNVRQMAIAPAEIPGSRPMRISMQNENRFKFEAGAERTLASSLYPMVSATFAANLNLIEFYNDYPVAYVNHDVYSRWRFYANVPISRQAKYEIYPCLMRPFVLLNERERVEVILNFVQTALEYGRDKEIWGKDRAFFAEESLHYPFSDCEDRAILFSRLVRDLVGLDVVLVYYPNHLATAVKFTDLVEGDYIMHDGARYTVCDPTYINAVAGETMPGMDNASAVVLEL